jgi:uncharacterized repeat protein (TIGR02543 family)
MYTVTYDGNNNTGGDVPIDPPREYRTSAIVFGNPGALVRTEFIFSGWSTRTDGTDRVYVQGSKFTVMSDITLYARWIPVTYTVTYNGNTNTSGTVPVDTTLRVTGTSATVLDNTGSLLKPGFNFAGWNTLANGAGTSYSHGDTFTITANTTLYARWTPVTYTVTYDGNDNTSGDVPTDTTPRTSGATVTVLGNTGDLLKTGFNFAGWNTQANGTGTSYAQGSTFTITANMTLYAKWGPLTYTVTYAGNTNTGGNVPTDNSQYINGATVTVLGNSGSLLKSGFNFAGWNTQDDGAGTTYSQGSRFTMNGDITLYARWASASLPQVPTTLSSVGGNTEAYILFTQTGTVTNYEYSTDNGVTFLAFNPPQIYSPVNIKTLSSDGVTPLTNGTTYTVILKAVNAGVSSLASAAVNVVPAVTSLETAGRIIYLDANNSSSYDGTGSTWRNLVSDGSYSAALNGAPAFSTTDPGNKYFKFNPGTTTGQFAQINQSSAINVYSYRILFCMSSVYAISVKHPIHRMFHRIEINPKKNEPFTIQIWARINNVGSLGTLVGKVFTSGTYDGYALRYMTDTNVTDTILQLHENGSSQIHYFNSVTGVLSNGWTLYTANINFGNGAPNKIFVNGRQVASATSDESGFQDNTQNLTLATGFNAEGKCDIGQFYYYNTQLSTAQIIKNFDATKHMYM